MNEFFSDLENFLLILKDNVISLGRTLALTIIAIGLVSWAVYPIFGYTGKRLIVSGIMLLIILEILS